MGGLHSWSIPRSQRLKYSSARPMNWHNDILDQILGRNAPSCIASAISLELSKVSNEEKLCLVRQTIFSYFPL